MTIEVVNSQVYGNPYQKLLYTAIGHRYQIASGRITKSIEQQQATGQAIYHIHWEDALFGRCKTVAQAIKVKRDYIDNLKQYVALGGKLVWTIHNIKPHEWRFIQTFYSLRKELAALSHHILVHNQAALSLLQEQTGLTDLSKVSVLPHPTYFDVYEPADKTVTLAGSSPRHPRTLIYFGLVRPYKGIPNLVARLPPEFMLQHRLKLHIFGQPIRADSFLTDLLAEAEKRPDLECSLGAVPDDAVADLLRSGAGLIIPYHKVLTSGVAVLSLTLGVPTVAPDTLAMKELYPESSHHLLFNPRSPKDLRRAVLALADMSADQRMQVAKDYIERAQNYHPQKISTRLGTIYDNLLGVSLNK